MTSPSPSSGTKTILVRCSYTLPVEVPADWDDHTISFAIEENSCPATGAVGAALGKRLEEQDAKGCCWACGLDAENKIVSLSPISQKNSPILPH